MKKLFVLSMVLFFSKTIAQGFKIDSTKYERLKIEYGILIPLGNLKDKFETSHEMGFWYRTRIVHNDIMDFGLTLTIPSNAKRFNYYGNDSIFRVKTKGLNGIVGIRMNKFYKLNQKLILSWNSSIGYSFFIFDDLEGRLYDIQNPPSKQQSEQDNDIEIKTYSKALSSICLGQGLAISYKQIGFQCNYNFNPYNWFSKRIDANFGTSSLSLSVFLKLKNPNSNK